MVSSVVETRLCVQKKTSAIVLDFPPSFLVPHANTLKAIGVMAHEDYSKKSRDKKSARAEPFLYERITKTSPPAM